MIAARPAVSWKCFTIDIVMSLNDIQLPKLVIAEIYARVLVEPGDIKNQSEPDLAESGSPVARSPYLGQNRKNILVIVYYPGEEFLPAKQLEFLTSILKACHLILDDIAIVNPKEQKGLSGILTEFNPGSVLSFGSKHMFTSLIKDPEYFNITASGGMKIIFAPELEWLSQKNNEAKDHRFALWQSLKQLFRI